jgi:hypothetical protein
MSSKLRTFGTTDYHRQATNVQRPPSVTPVTKISRPESEEGGIIDASQDDLWSRRMTGIVFIFGVAIQVLAEPRWNVRGLGIWIG